MRVLHRSIVCLLVAAVGCGGSTTTGTTSPLVGTYDLRTVNGAPLPFAFPPSNGSTLSVTAEVLTVNADGTYKVLTTESIVTITGTVGRTGTEIGTWSTANGITTFDDVTDGGSFNGTLSGTTMTQVAGTLTRVYAKR